VVKSMNRRKFLRYAGIAATLSSIAAGASVNYLPSELRHHAFAGAVELDLKAAQLAIVSRLWDIPSLREALEAALHAPEGEDRSIWRKLADWMRVTAEYKPILKRTISSLVFGMLLKKLIQQLAGGNFLEGGVGPNAGRRIPATMAGQNRSNPVTMTALSGGARRRAGRRRRSHPHHP